MAHSAGQTIAVLFTVATMTSSVAIPYAQLSSGGTPKTIIQRLDEGEKERNEIRQEQARIETGLQSIEKELSVANEKGTTGARVSIAALQAEMVGLKTIGEDILKGMLGILGLILGSIMTWVWRTMRMAANLRATENRLLSRHEQTVEAIQETKAAVQVVGEKAVCAYEEANHVNRKLRELATAAALASTKNEFPEGSS